MDSLLTVVSKPSGTLVAVEKVLVTKRPATTEHAFDVLFNQFPPSSTSFWWFLVKISSRVWLLLLLRKWKLLCNKDFLMYCMHFENKKTRLYFPIYFKWRGPNAFCYYIDERIHALTLVQAWYKVQTKECISFFLKARSNRWTHCNNLY